MTAQQKFSKKLEEETSDHERSILLVDIMNAIGFSKGERQIQRHGVHLMNVLIDIFRTVEHTVAHTGSTAEGLHGGIYGNKDYHDSDILWTVGDIKLYTPRTNTMNHPPL